MAVANSFMGSNIPLRTFDLIKSECIPMAWVIEHRKRNKAANAKSPSLSLSLLFLLRKYLLKFTTNSRIQISNVERKVISFDPPSHLQFLNASCSICNTHAIKFQFFCSVWCLRSLEPLFSDSFPPKAFSSSQNHALKEFHISWMADIQKRGCNNNTVYCTLDNVEALIIW